MKYKIYQIRNIGKCDYAFRDWECAQKLFNIADYHMVYDGEMEQKYILEKLFEKFNLDRPDDFRGHSLSVSDVVALKKEGNDYWYWYYCDDIGWTEITEEIGHL